MLVSASFASLIGDFLFPAIYAMSYSFYLYAVTGPLDWASGMETAASQLLMTKTKFITYTGQFPGYAVFPIVIATLFAITLLGIARLLGSRLTVFISYHQSMISDARGVAKALRDNGISVLWIDNVRSDHDALLDEVNAKLGRSNFVVCLPGDGQSFVDAEILAAILTKRPLIFLLESSGSSIPNTAQKSFPVMMLPRLRLANYRGLVTLLRFLHGEEVAVGGVRQAMLDDDRRSVLHLVMLIFSLCFITTLAAGGFLAVCKLISCSQETISLIGPIRPVAFTSTVLLFGGSMFMSVKIYRMRAGAMSVARRSVALGDFDATLFRDLFGNNPFLQEALSTLSDTSPIPHHERGSRRI